MTAPARLATLGSIEATIWLELQRATQDRQHEWRTPVLASVAAEGGADARSVVLREVTPEAQRLLVYSDRRAPKLAQLRREARATLLCWSRRLGWQLRLRAHCRIVDDEATLAAAWQHVATSAGAADYLSALAPGSDLTAEAGPGQDPHFAVIDIEVLAVDWLELHRDGHRRAAFDGAGARWLQP